MIDVKTLEKVVSHYGPYLKHNADLLQIFEGDLLPFIDSALKSQLSHQSYEQVRHRIFPVNILPKVIDKLTNIYQTTVVRTCNGTEKDQELIEWYVEQMGLNEKMNCGNELFNLCQGSLLYPSVYEGKPYIRPIKNDRFIVLGQDPNMPERPTDVIICAGLKDNKEVFWVIDDKSFVVYTGGEIDREEMARLGNPAGINPYGVLPYIWVNDSKYSVMPVQDSSVMKVVTTLPVMISDLNLAAMFQAFSIVYGIDVDDEDIKFAPNAFWRFKTDLAADKKPELGQIKPQVDIDQVIRLVESELSMWLGTKGIRAGTIGSISPDNFSSGISKVIDEMDTYEARQKQTVTFQYAEQQLWDFIMYRAHPYWVATGQIENIGMFSPGIRVKTTFAVQLPQQKRGEIVRDLRDEVAAGFTTRQMAIRRLNPEMTESEVEALIKEIEGVYDEAVGSGGDGASDQSSQTVDGGTAQGTSGSNY